MRVRILLPVLLLVACGETAPGGDDDDQGTPPERDAGIGGGVGRDGGGPPVAFLESIALEPASADLMVEGGAPLTQQFSVVGTYSDGRTEPVAGRFEVEPLAIGTIDPISGLMTVHGTVGGEATVRARAVGPNGELVAEATVRVFRRDVFVDPGVAPTIPALFDGPITTDTTRSADLVYPLDGAVMPQNVPPARIAWLRQAVGDVFEVTLTKPNVEVVAYVTSLDWLVGTEAWRALAQTDPEAPAQIRVDRLDAATMEVIEGRTISVRFAAAALSGSIYYWDINAGRIIRINDGTTDRDAFFPSPPLGCVGCHSVSTSGRYMAGRFGGGDNIGGVLDLTKDLTTDPPPLEFPISQMPPSLQWWFSTWSPDDTRMIVSQSEGNQMNRAFALVDPFTGMSIMPAAGALPTGGVTHPAWAPNDSAIAYVQNADVWGGANATGDIAMVSVLGPDRFGAETIVLRGDQVPNPRPAGTAASYPTWSPDATQLAFAHGTSSRSENGASALYMMSPDGSRIVRLDNANGGPDTADTFQPRFSPFEQGGYFWMSYLSRRDYGNASSGTRGTNRQQIWISAIDADAPLDSDPSEVGYWLPGQDTTSLNISAYWAPRACRGDGEACTVASECCSGDCRPDENGVLSCSPEMSTECAELGEACLNSSDCCEGICSAGLCMTL